MSRIVVTPREGGVVLWELDDPDRRNAMGPGMAAAMVEAAAALRADPSVRVLVVTGRGKAFCAGADLPALFGEPGARPIQEVHAGLQAYYRAFLAVRELPFPTVAAVNGAAVGAGLNLAMACDARVAGPHATFGATFARIGLHPGGGCTWFLVRALGASRALSALLLGETMDAPTAVRLGLAEGPEDDPLAAALDLAGRYAAVDPLLARHIKRAVGIAVETDSLAATLEYETWAQAASANSEQLAAWVAGFAR